MEHVTPIRRRGRLATVLAAVVGLAALLTARSATAQQTAFDILPLAPGNTWSYSGTVWWVPRNSRRVLEERVQLEMRVVTVAERPGARAALLAGYPPDLLTSAPSRFEGEFGLFQFGQAVYLLRGERAREALQRIADPSDSLADLLPGSEVVLDLPLAEGKSFCSPRDESRRGPGTCWFVRDEGPVQRSPVVGLEGAAGDRGYVLALESRTEHEVRGFVPGIGFTSFAIGNFGDPSAMELELVDARLATPPRHGRGLFLKTLDLSDAQMIEMATTAEPSERVSKAEGSAEPEPVLASGPAAETETVETPGPETSLAGGVSSPPEPDEPPFPSPDRLLPDERPFQILRPARPVAIEVALEELPVPVWEDTRPACLDAREWYIGESPIRIDGREYDPVGSAEPIDPDNLVPVGEYDGVPTFAGRLSETPHADLWLPLCGTPSTFRLYADLRGG
ncbi:MAG TPA: hypothetical protein VFG78_06820 [Gemmatimonadota bacterium]|nr:hypothetical protein [Gemmatimonadota bacterium]